MEQKSNKLYFKKADYCVNKQVGTEGERIPKHNRQDTHKPTHRGLTEDETAVRSRHGANEGGQTVTKEGKKERKK